MDKTIAYFLEKYLLKFISHLKELGEIKDKEINTWVKANRE
jgi:hypothetical protein